MAEDVQFQYVWDVRYVDAPVVRFHDSDTDGYLDAEGGILYYTTDANWNVTALVDAETGEVVERYMYDPYGKATVCEEDWTPREGNASAVANDVLYCGYRFDAETGLYHVRYRYYHPTMGRWATRDPAGTADGNNIYQYVGSSPQANCDPFGLGGLTLGTWLTPVKEVSQDDINTVMRDKPGFTPDRYIGYATYSFEYSFRGKAELLSREAGCCLCWFTEATVLMKLTAGVLETQTGEDWAFAERHERGHLDDFARAFARPENQLPVKNEFNLHNNRENAYRLTAESDWECAFKCNKHLDLMLVFAQTLMHMRIHAEVDPKSAARDWNDWQGTAWANSLPSPVLGSLEGD